MQVLNYGRGPSASKVVLSRLSILKLNKLDGVVASRLILLIARSGPL